jgi:hypothetical protein
MKPQRNKPCPCGSGLKYKKCCYLLPPEKPKPKERKTPTDIQSRIKWLQMYGLSAGFEQEFKELW